MQVDIDIILNNQHPSGAYVASPNFSQYPYCWLRDGAFIAHAMDRASQGKSAAAFHHWVAATLSRYEGHITALVAAAGDGRPPEHDAFLPARYTLDGEWLEDGWPSFQLDGYGQWLWSLSEHIGHGGKFTTELAHAARLAADYLNAYWQEPCYDAWEEGRTQLHTSTLASSYAGLRGAGKLFDGVYEDKAEEIRRFILNSCVDDGHFVKWVRNSAVDASLLWLATPFDLVTPDHPIMKRTVELIESRLVHDGGVIRYEADSFYGAGAWILLTAWLGWHYVRSGQLEHARACLDWVEAQRDDQGHLPEQVAVSTTDPWFCRYWRERWGEPAKPLLWSHAMTIVLKVALSKGVGL